MNHESHIKAFDVILKMKELRQILRVSPRIARKIAQVGSRKSRLSINPL